MTTAIQSSWKTLPPTKLVEPLQFEAHFDDVEAEQMREGLILDSMEDKWFVYFADGWLRFHRSWSGALIYSIRLDGTPAGVRVAESWVNRDPAQYKGRDTEYDRKLLRFLIDAFLLKKADVVFPMPSTDKPASPGVVQHSYVGRAYVESPAPSQSKKPD